MRNDENTLLYHTWMCVRLKVKKDGCKKYGLQIYKKCMFNMNVPRDMIWEYFLEGE